MRELEIIKQEWSNNGRVGVRNQYALPLLDESSE